MECLLSYQQANMSHLFVIPTSPNVNFWAAPVSSRQEAPRAAPFATQIKNLTILPRWVGSRYLPEAGHNVGLQNWQDKGLSLEKKMATQSSIIAWRVSWTE